MRAYCFAGLILWSLGSLLPLDRVDAAVIRLAPEFGFPGAGNKVQTLRSLRGQSVVLLIAKNPENRSLKKQAKYLREIYEQFASKKVVFVAALGSGTGPIQSDIPFVVASNGPAVASAYGVQGDFSLVIIGKDGNVDYQTNKVCSPERVRDVIQNSFEVQETSRKGQ